MLTSRVSRSPRSATMGADPLGRVVLGQIGGDVAGLAGQLLGQGPQTILAAGDEDQLGAGLARKPPRRRLADPARGSRDQCRDWPGTHAPNAIRFAGLRTLVRIDILPPCDSKTPGLLDKLLRAPGPLRLRGPGGGGLARGSLLRLALRRRDRLLGRPHRRRGAAAGGGRAHRRDRPGDPPHRRAGLPLVCADRGLGPADPGRPASRGPGPQRAGARRRRPQAPPPARRRPAQEGRRDEVASHRRRRRRPRRGRSSWCGSATRS